MKVLAMDFDGVIADSQFECLVVGFNSYLRLNKNTKLFNGQKITFNNCNKIKNKYKKIIEKYKNLRPYVIDAFCWFVILSIIENNIKIKSQNHYNHIRNRLMNNIYDEYVKYFYNERYKLQKQNFRKWLKLEIPFKKIIDAVKKFGKKYIMVIVTNNRKDSILPFLKNYNLNPKIISDSKISIDKKKQISFIKNKLKVNFNDIHFIDDQEVHFSKLVKLGINCYLALWGYNNKTQQKDARKLGATLLNEYNFYKTLSKK